MKFFRIMMLSMMMFTWLQSNAMEAPDQEPWTEQKIERIVRLQDDKEVIQYWKAFWLQMKPDDIFDMENSELKGFGDHGECKNTLESYIAERFDTRLDHYKPYIKNRLRLGKLVLAGGLNENNIFLKPIPEKLLKKSKESGSILPDGDHDSDDDSSSSSSEDNGAPIIPPQPRDNGIFTTALKSMRANPLLTISGAVIVVGGVYWAYKKYQAYKAAQKEAEQVDEQAENEETETDQAAQKNAEESN